MLKSTTSTHPERTSLFDQLGVIGFSSIEAPLLAALATDSPLLLIGPHGTAKSLLLNKIAEALNLNFRHYNASLLNFDDLVGFPLPSADGTLQYVKRLQPFGEQGQSSLMKSVVVAPISKISSFPSSMNARCKACDLSGCNTAGRL